MIDISNSGSQGGQQSERKILTLLKRILLFIPFHKRSTKYPCKKGKLDPIFFLAKNASKNIDRSSRLQMFLKIGVLKNFAMFTGKHLCWSLFSIIWNTFGVCSYIKVLEDFITFLSHCKALVNRGYSFDQNFLLYWDRGRRDSTHVSLMFCFYTPWKSQKSFGFLTFPGGIGVEHRVKFGWYKEDRIITVSSYTVELTSFLYTSLRLSCWVAWLIIFDERTFFKSKTHGPNLKIAKSRGWIINTLQFS